MRNVVPAEGAVVTGSIIRSHDVIQLLTMCVNYGSTRQGRRTAGIRYTVVGRPKARE